MLYEKNKYIFSCLSHCDFHPFPASGQKQFLTETNVDKLGVGGEQKVWRTSSDVLLADGVDDGASCKGKEWKGTLGTSTHFSLCALSLRDLYDGQSMSRK